MQKLNTIEEIKQAVNEGKKVYAESLFYQVIKDAKEQFLIKASNGYTIGLHGAEGTKYESVLNANNFFTIE